MSSRPTPTQAAPIEAAQDAHRQRDALNELMDMGVDIARQIHRHITAEDMLPAPEATAQFDRIARAVRRTILLARHVATPLPTRSAEPSREAARRRVLRDVEDTIGLATNDRTRAEKLNAELLERLDTPEFEDEIGHRPTAEIVADIIRDLGIHNHSGFTPHRRRTPQDIAILHARAARHPEPAYEAPAPASRRVAADSS